VPNVLVHPVKVDERQHKATMRLNARRTVVNLNASFSQSPSFSTVHTTACVPPVVGESAAPRRPGQAQKEYRNSWGVGARHCRPTSTLATRHP
jgi:hypothetical protein